MKPLLLVSLSVILSLTNVAGAVTILSEYYHVYGRGFVDGYDEGGNLPPVYGHSSDYSAESGANYFRVYASADIYIGPPQDLFAWASADAIYEIQPSNDYLRIEIGNATSYTMSGQGGFYLTDQTDNVLIASSSWNYWAPREKHILSYPVDTEHQYKFILFASADSWMSGWHSDVDVAGDISSVPEPATLLLLGLGGTILLRRRRN
jgi:hypothetical protein